MIQQGLCISARQEFLRGIHQAEDLYMLALYDKEATLTPKTAGYKTQCEVIGQGYSAGGLALSGYSVGDVNGIAYLTWTEPCIWYGCTVQTRGGLIYNRSRGNKAIAVLDFNDIVPAKNGVLSVGMPPSGAGGLILWD